MVLFETLFLFGFGKKKGEPVKDNIYDYLQKIYSQLDINLDELSKNPANYAVNLNVFLSTKIDVMERFYSVNHKNEESARIKKLIHLLKRLQKIYNIFSQKTLDLKFRNEKYFEKFKKVTHKAIKKIRHQTDKIEVLLKSHKVSRYW